MAITRRDWLAQAAILGSGGGIALSSSAWAEPVSLEELMNPGPLPDRAVGAQAAPVTVIEYASLSCGHCAQFAITTFPELKSHYIQSGKVRYVFREFPLDPLAAAASMVARSVPEEQYFTVIDILFQQQRQWVANRIQPLMTLATKEFGFTEQSFKACVANQQLLNALQQQRERAANVFKIRSTPSFFVNGKYYGGYKSIAQMKELIEPILKT